MDGNHQIGSRPTLVIGSRGSDLALWQARYLAERLEQLGVASTIEIIKTTGDRLQTASLVQAGGKGLFTKEIEDALLSQEIDVAVHSLKDLPTEGPLGLDLAAIPEREDPRDALVGATWSELPQRARVGTSSLRRAAQLRALRPDLGVISIRGNVDTRLRKLRDGQYDAIVLAAAGLRRLGLASEIAHLFSADQICSAPGQGALAIQTRRNSKAHEVCSQIDHEASRRAVSCERSVLSTLGGGCSLPLGALAELKGGDMQVTAVAISSDGRRQIRIVSSGPADRPEDLGAHVARQLLDQGAESLFALSSASLVP